MHSSIYTVQIDEGICCGDSVVGTNSALTTEPSNARTSLFRSGWLVNLTDVSLVVSSPAVLSLELSKCRVVAELVKSHDDEDDNSDTDKNQRENVVVVYR